MTVGHGQCRVGTATIVGVEAIPVDVEVDVTSGIPSFSIVGLADIAVQEARERVRSALRASGFELPNSRVVVNLAPGPLRKHGTGFDLPIAIGLLAATRQLSHRLVQSVLAVGELSLDGTVRRTPGLMAHALSASARKLPLLGPPPSQDLSDFDDLEYLPLRALSELRMGLPDPWVGSRVSIDLADEMDFGDVVGQDLAVRALEIAAAGGHNVLMIGPPGAGKTMLARRLPSILPPLSQSELLQTALVYSVAGLDGSAALAGRRPFRAPHHSASIAGLVGGGTPPRPGEASLAHNGVLFLDEMPEFGPAALQCLRQPMEDGLVLLVRADGRVRFPSRFALVGAANPCPCGFLGDISNRCSCPPGVVERYRSRIGGPLMDRIDLVVEVGRPDPRLLLEKAMGTSSESLKNRVAEARDRAASRGSAPAGSLSGAQLLEDCRLDAPARRHVESAARRQQLSGRGVTRLLRVARTIADLETRPSVEDVHIAEALAYRVAGR